jgi:curli biogenesis system outer membrane secretion channel CsgG
MQAHMTKRRVVLAGERSMMHLIRGVKCLLSKVLPLFFVLSVNGALVTAAAVEVTVEVQATGVNQADAINNALIQAIQQVTGVRINSVVMSDLQLDSRNANGKDSHQLDEKFQKNIKNVINGVVKEYRITSMDVQPKTGAQVQLTVTIDKYTPVGLSADSRRKIAVMPFAEPSGRVTQGGVALQTSLIAYIVKTRRFAVLDRSNSDAYSQEMALITSGQTPMSEQARIAQVLSADYLITGTLRAARSNLSQQYIPLTGETVTNVTGSAGRADFSLMEVATRQVKFAGHVDVSGSNDVAAEKIGFAIIEAIYPLRIIDASDPTELVINQGGDSVKVGQRFAAFVLGVEQFDPYTKESLGRREKEAAQIEISRVLPKMSYAKVIKGALPPTSGVEIVLRRPTANAATVNTRATPAVQQPQAPTITKLPFDK